MFPLKLTLKFNSHFEVLRGRTFRKSLGHGGSALMNGLLPLSPQWVGYLESGMKRHRGVLMSVHAPSPYLSSDALCHAQKALTRCLHLDIRHPDLQNCKVKFTFLHNVSSLWHSVIAAENRPIQGLSTKAEKLEVVILQETGIWKKEQHYTEEYFG